MWRKFMPHLIALAVLCGVLMFFMHGMLDAGLPKLHDSNPHISRMIAFHTALGDGQFPPMWAKEMLGGIGSPVMMLNYQLPYFVAEGFVRAGSTFFDGYKLTLVLSFVLAGITMYLALSQKFTPLTAWLGAMIYSLAPYRFVDIYVRGALGESLTFIFPPLLILGFAKKSLPILIIGWAGLFLTHPTASAAFTIFFLGYTIYIGERGQLAKRLKLFMISFGTAVLIAAFNLLPTILLTKYTYYSPELSDTLLMFPSLSQLFHSAWGYGVSLPGINDGMSFEVGLVQWGALLAGAYLALKKKNLELRYLMVTSLVCLFFMLPISTPIYQVLHLSKYIDFPWRLLFCIVFAAAWVGAIVSSKIRDYRLQWSACFVVVILLVWQSLPIARVGSYWHKSDVWFARETGDSYGEYAPLTRSTRDSAPFWLRAEPVEGAAKVEMLLDKSNDQIYKIIAESPSTIRINTSYFPGWEVKVDDKVVPLGETCFITKRTQKDIDDSGLVACKVEPGKHKIEIDYRATTVQRIGNLITLAGIGGYLWILSASYYLHTTKRKQ